MAKRFDYFSDDHLRANLKRHTVHAGLYTAVAQGVGVAAQLAAIPILARLLEPEDFGLVAMVTALTAFAAMFVDVGLSLATIQRPNITHGQISNLFWISAGLGGAVAAVVAMLSPAIAWFYGEPRLVGITLVLCLSFVFAGLTMQHQALLRRAMRFRWLAAVQSIAVLTAYAAALSWAWWYRDYWAMVLLPVTMAFVRMIGMWIACRWMPGVMRRGTGVWQMLTFGGYLTGFNMTNYFSRNADNMLIGWWWGAAPLGFYERAYKLLMFPLHQINGPLTTIAVPALSRTLDDPVRYRRAYLTMLESLLLVTLPLMAFVFVTRDLCIEVLLGPKWRPAVPIFAWLGVGAGFQPFMQTLGWLLVSQGRTREMFQWSIFAALISVVSFMVGLPWGPVAVAAAYVIANASIHMTSLVYWTTRKGPVRAHDLVPCFKLPLVLAATLFIGLMLLRQVLDTGTNFYDLAICLFVAVALWAAVMLATSPGQRWVAYYGKSLVGK